MSLKIIAGMILWVVAVALPAQEIVESGIQLKGAQLILTEEIRFGAVEDDDSYQWPSLQTKILPAPNGQMFIFDHEGSRVLLFDKDGKFVKQVARGGEGPGELTQTNGIGMDGEFLYTHTPQFVQRFNKMGVFEKKWARPIKDWCERVTGGWIYSPGVFSGSDKLVLWDNHFKKKQVLASWDSGYKREKRGEGKGFKITRDFHSSVVIGLAQQYVYVMLSEPLTVQIFDVTTAKKVHSFSVLVANYNQNWMPVPGYEPKPEDRIYRPGYPLRSNLFLGPRGHIYLFPGDRFGYAFVFDHTGKQYRAEFTRDELERIVAWEHDLYYVSYQDPENDDLCLARMHKDKIRGFIADHAIDE